MALQAHSYSKVPADDVGNDAGNDFDFEEDQVRQNKRPILWQMTKYVVLHLSFLSLYAIVTLIIVTKFGHRNPPAYLTYSTPRFLL